MLALATPAAAAPAPEVVVGLITELSGEAAGIGSDCRAGFELARRDVVGGYRLRFLYADHKSDPKTGVSEFQRMVESEGVWAVVINRNPVVMAVSPLSQRHRLPILAATGHPDLRRLNPYALEFWPVVDDEARVLTEYLASQGVQDLAVLSTVDSWTLALRNAVRSQFERNGGKMVSDREIEKDDRDLAPYAAAVKRSGARGVFLNLRPGQVGMAARRVREAGYRGTLISNLYLAESEEIATAGKDAVEGAVYAQLNHRQRAFSALLASLGSSQRDVGPVSYSCYAAVTAILETLRRHPDVTDKLQFAERLVHLDGLQLPDEHVPFSDRVARYRLSLARIEGGAARVMNEDEWRGGGRDQR